MKRPFCCHGMNLLPQPQPQPRSLDGNFTLRDAVEEDCEAILKVHLDSIKNLCSPYYSQAEIKVWLGTPTTEYYARTMKTDEFVVVVDNADENRIVAFGQIGEKKRLEFSEHVDYQLDKLYVHSSKAFKGVGTFIYKELERRAVINRGARGIGVLTSLNAIPFYEKLGFSTVGTCTGMLSNLQCPIMEKKFTLLY